MFYCFLFENSSFVTGNHASQSDTVGTKISPNNDSRSSSYSTVNTLNLNYKKISNVRINVTLRNFNITVVAVEKKVLHILSACL